MASNRANVQSHNNIVNSLKQCVNQLEAVAQRVKVNKESLAPDVIQEWRERSIQLGKDIAVARNKSEITKEVVETIIGNKRRNEDDNSNEDLKPQIMEAIREKCAKFDENKDANVKSLVNLLVPANRRQSDEFEVVEEGFKASDTICPYTKMVFQEAMKSEKCKHHVSRMALDQMLRSAGRAGADCPVAGCSGKWSKNLSSPDEDYQRQVDRFLKLQAMTKSSASQFATSVDDDEEYTAI